VYEFGVVEIKATSGILPSQVEAEPLDSIAVAETLETLKHHHHRDNSRRHRPTTNLCKEVCEALVGEEPVALLVKQRVERRRRQMLAAKLRARAENLTLLRCLTQRHGA